jgi:hypothetical protein
MRLEKIHIPAISPDYFEQPLPAAGVISASLEQRNRFRFRKHTFKLIDQRILSVKTDGITKPLPDYEFNIGILNPEPKRLVSINWGYLAAFLILAVSATLAARSELFPDSIMASSLLAANAIVFLVLTAYSCHNRLVFYSMNGWVPLVILMYRNPNDEKFQAFTDALRRQIRNIQSNFGSPSEMLRDDLIEHRRLMERGIISENRYDLIKQYILCLHEKTPRIHLHGGPAKR